LNAVRRRYIDFRRVIYNVILHLTNNPTNEQTNGLTPGIEFGAFLL